MTDRSDLALICGVIRPDPDWPVAWQYECVLMPDHDGDHEATGSDPLVTWPRSEFELVVIEPNEVPSSPGGPK
jgi:hypothetical protein